MLPERLSALRVALLLAAIIAAAYGTSLRNGFVHDDTIFMAQDPRVQSPRELSRLFVESRWAFRDRDGRVSIDQYYRPLEPLPYALSHLLFSGQAWPAHLLNLLFHLGNALLVFAALRRVVRHDGGALVGAAVFAVYPAYSEAVLWPAALGGLGAFTCTLAIFLVQTGDARAPLRKAALTALLYLCALWFKETGALAPLFVALYDLVAAPDRGWRRLLRRWARYLAFVPPLALYLALRLHALGEPIPGLEHVPLTGRELILNAVALVAEHTRAFLWPVDLTFHHDFDPVRDAAHPRFLAGLALLLAALVVMVLAWRRDPPLAFAVAWMLVAVAPYLHVHVPQGNVFAERYLYDPAFGACAVLACAWRTLTSRAAARVRRLAALAAAAVVLVFVAADVRRAADWRDELTLFSKTLTQSRRAEVIRVNLAVRLHALGRYDEGVEVLEELIEIAPAQRGLWHNLGLLYQAQERWPEAIAAYERARQTDPGNAATLLNLGYLLDRRGRRDEAVRLYLRTVDLLPGHVDAWHNLAVVALEAGQHDNARHAAERVLEQRPGDAAAAHILQRIDAAGPSPRADRQTTLLRCAAAKAMIDEGRVERAAYALRAASWLDERAALPHHYLANLYVLQGRLPEAIEHQRAAVERAPQMELYRTNLAALEAAVRDPSE